MPNQIPDGWTDDLSVVVDPDRSIDELVDFLIETEPNDVPWRDRMLRVSNRFGLCFDDVRLAFDRFQGGRVRAQGAAANRPDPTKDPVAFASWSRARGEPAPARAPLTTRAWGRLRRLVAGGQVDDAMAWVRSREFAAEATAPERDVAAAWAEAAGGEGGTRGLGDTFRMLLLLSLATAMTQGGSGDAAGANVLLQAATSVSGLAERRVDERGSEPYAHAGTPLWFDAIRITNAATTLSRLFRKNGDPKSEGRCLAVAGYVTVNLLGHCYERVGAVMLADARHAMRTGQPGEALGRCRSLISDFSRLLVPACEQTAEEPLEEQCIALEQLIEAIEIASKVEGATSDEHRGLLARSRSLLARADAAG